MSTPKQQWRHHYVPEMLLKRFEDDSGLLHIIDRVRNVRRPADKARNVGFSRDFYRLEERPDGNAVEDALATLEAEAAPIIDRIVDTRTVPASNADWLVLMNFVAIQAARVPATKRLITRPIRREREIIADMIRHDPRLYKRNAHVLGIDPEAVSYNEFLGMTDTDLAAPVSTEEFVLSAMSIAKPILKSINRRLWTVIHSDEPGEHFVISDDPVVLYWSDGVRRRLPPGYDHVDADVTIPLSSEVALVLTHPDFKVPDGGIRHQVARTNSKTIAASNHFIAAKSESFICYGSQGLVELSQITEPLAIPPLLI